MRRVRSAHDHRICTVHVCLLCVQSCRDLGWSLPCRPYLESCTNYLGILNPILEPTYGRSVPYGNKRGFGRNVQAEVQLKRGMNVEYTPHRPR